MTRQEYVDIYDFVGAASDHKRGLLLNFGEKRLRAERYLYLPEDDDFILLTQENYKDYIDEV